MWIGFFVTFHKCLWSKPCALIFVKPFIEHIQSAGFNFIQEQDKRVAWYNFDVSFQAFVLKAGWKSTEKGEYDLILDLSCETNLQLLMYERYISNISRQTLVLDNHSEYYCLVEWTFTDNIIQD